jgi:hypothetical protein
LKIKEAAAKQRCVLCGLTLENKCQWNRFLVNGDAREHWRERANKHVRYYVL